MGRHARSDDEVSEALLLEDLSYELGTVDYAVNIDAHLFPVVFEGLLQKRLRDGHACVGNEDVDATKVGKDILDDLLDFVDAGHWSGPRQGRLHQIKRSSRVTLSRPRLAAHHRTCKP